MKRFGSLFLTVTLCLFMLSAPSKAATPVSNVTRLSSEQASAYYRVLNAAIEDSKKDTYMSGTLFAQLIDFNCDGSPELYIRTENYRPDQIWSFEGRDAVQIFSGDYTDAADADTPFYGGDGGKRTTLIEYQGKPCLVYYAFTGGNHIQAYSCSVLSMEGAAIKPIDYCLEQTSYTLMPEEHSSYSYRLNGGQWQSSENRDSAGAMFNFLNKYGISSDFVESGNTWKQDAALSLEANTLLQSLIPSLPETTARLALLKKLPYLGGDVSDCQMTVDQAEGYIDVLKNAKFPGYSLQATLLDFGDGNPVLFYFSARGKGSTENSWNNETTDSELWFEETNPFGNPDWDWDWEGIKSSQPGYYEYWSVWQWDGARAVKAFDCDTEHEFLASYFGQAEKDIWTFSNNGMEFQYKDGTFFIDSNRLDYY